jgi:hypothetical protein
MNFDMPKNMAKVEGSPATVKTIRTAERSGAVTVTTERKDARPKVREFEVTVSRGTVTLTRHRSMKG